MKAEKQRKKMVVFKCEMCGGNLEIQEKTSVCVCPYCGTKQSLPGWKGTEASQAGASGDGSKTAALLKRAFLFLEDGEFDRADEYCERVLDLDPENAEAYLGKLMVQREVNKRKELAWEIERLDKSDAFRKVMRFGGKDIRKELEGYNQQIIQKEEQWQKEKLDREIQEQKRKREQELKRREEIYQSALQILESATESSQVQEAINQLKMLGEYKDAAALITTATEKLAQLEKSEQEKRKKQKKRRIFAAALGTVAVVFISILCILGAQSLHSPTVQFRGYKKDNYAVRKAENLIRDGEYGRAYRRYANVLGRGELRDLFLSVAVEELDAEKYKEAKQIIDNIPLYFYRFETEDAQLGDDIFQKALEYVEKEECEKADILLSIMEKLSKNMNENPNPPAMLGRIE